MNKNLKVPFIFQQVESLPEESVCMRREKASDAVFAKKMKKKKLE